jgi:magnesium chelatase subunit D
MTPDAAELPVWDDALRALALFAIDPVGLGGVSLRAPAGPIRDQWLTLVRTALPPNAPIRRVPANVGDDRLLGGLDLAATLQAGRPVRQSGLLAASDGGVMVLAMAERIEPGAAARLCAVVDQGVVAVPRDGLTRDEPARFGLIALDEGAEADERPPASLLDRMGFHLDLTTAGARNIVPPDWTAAGLAEARSRLVDVSEDANALEVLCGIAEVLGIGSVRAPLFALRAARAAAVLAGRPRVTDEDLTLASRLVLAPRATRLPAATDEMEAPAEPPPAADTSEPERDTRQDETMNDVVLEAVLAALPPDLLAHLTLASGRPARGRVAGRAGQVRLSRRRGRPIGTRQGALQGDARLHLLDTLKAAAPWQTLRQRGEPTPGRIAVRPDDFRIVRFRQRTETTTIFAVDASGSAALHRLAEAKGAVELLLADCYVRRDQVALVAFRGQAASTLLPPTSSLTRAKRCLAGLPGGGATPLASGLDAATALADSERRRGRTPVVVVLTDGRANMTRDGAGGRAQAEQEAMDSARRARAAGLTALFVDTSPRANPFARKVAGEMGATYIPLPQADASAVSRAVRTAVST